MSQIEPKRTNTHPKVGSSAPVSSAQNVTGPIKLREIDFKKSTQSNAPEKNNPFFRWARAGRFAGLFSINSPQPTDRQALQHQSNEALIAKLTNIDTKLEAIKGTPFHDLYNGELSLGQIIIGEQIRRLRLAVAGKENRQSVQPNPGKTSQTPATQKIVQEGDDK